MQYCEPYPEGYYIGIAIVTLAIGQAIIGEGKCQLCKFPAMPSSELCTDLAVLDAVEKLQKYQQGQYRPAQGDQVARLRNRLAQWSVH